jgi:IS1 family transposase
MFTISKWIKRFAPVFKKIADDRLLGINLSDSDEWHFDETYIKIAGKDYYLWLAIDSETRLVLDFHLSPNRDSSAAHSLLSNCRKKFGQPRSAIISDRYYAYQQPASLFFPHAKHVRVEDFDDVCKTIMLLKLLMGNLKRGTNLKEALIHTSLPIVLLLHTSSFITSFGPIQVSMG